MIRLLVLHRLRALLVQMQLDLFALKPGIAYPESEAFIVALRYDIAAVKRTIELCQ